MLGGFNRATKRLLAHNINLLLAGLLLSTILILAARQWSLQGRLSSESTETELEYLRRQLAFFKTKYAHVSSAAQSSNGHPGVGDGFDVDHDEDPFLMLKRTIPAIYVITPTYPRLVQKAELTRLCHTLLLVPNLHWILVEDRASKTDMVGNFLSRDCKGISHTHLALQGEDHHDGPWSPQQSPFHSRALLLQDSAQNGRNASSTLHKGVEPRNRGLAWLAQHLSENPLVRGVLYFADDDNTYSLKLFEEMRYTVNASVWPVAFSGGVVVERPLVKRVGPGEEGLLRVVGWDVVFGRKRAFGVDMAGFAVNLDLVRKRPGARFLTSSMRGYLESDFLSQLTRVEDLEPKAEGCSLIYVWHTKTEAPSLHYERFRVEKLGLPPSGLDFEV